MLGLFSALSYVCTPSPPPEAAKGLKSCTVNQIGQVVHSLRGRKRSMDLSAAAAAHKA